MAGTFLPHPICRGTVNDDDAMVLFFKFRFIFFLTKNLFSFLYHSRELRGLVSAVRRELSLKTTMDDARFTSSAHEG